MQQVQHTEQSVGIHSASALDPETVPSLTVAEAAAGLSEKAPEARVKCARELRDFGPEAILPLCAALHDREGAVRLAAAESLGEVGDERAVQALIEALRACFPAKSPRRFRIMGLLLWITGILAAIAALALMIFTRSAPPIGDVADAAISTDEDHSAQPSLSESCRVISEALAKIAKRHPTPQLQGALGDLHDIAADSLQQDKWARGASRRTARRIERLTAKLGELPVASARPAEQLDEVLPRVSDTRRSDGDTLPRASEDPANPSSTA